MKLAWRRARAERLYRPGASVRLEKVELDSFGRVVADIRRWKSDRWLYIAAEMIDAEMAQPWQEGWPDLDWCVLVEKQ